MIPAPPRGFKLDNTISSPPSGFKLDIPEPPSGFKLDSDSNIGMGMPKDRPAAIPPPLEQLKVHGMASALPPPLSTEVKKAAIEKQREKDFGVYKNPSIIPNPITMAENAPENLKDIIKTTGSLMMNTARLAYNSMFDKDAAEEQLKPAVNLTGAIVKDIESSIYGREATELKKDPIAQAVGSGIETIKRTGVIRSISQFVEEKPLDALLIGNAFRAATGSGIRVSAKTAQKILPESSKLGAKLDDFLSTERTPIVYELPSETQGLKIEGKVAPKEVPSRAISQEIIPNVEKTIEFPRKYSDDPFTKYVFQKSFDKALDTFPNAKKALAERNATKLVSKIRDTYDKANFRERVALNEEVLKQINTLSKEEQAIMIPYLEGRVQLINDSSEAFTKFEGWYRDLSDTINKDLVSMGKLTPQQIQARLYQPLTKATGKTADEIITELGDFTPAYVHHAFPDKFPQKTGDFFADTTGKRYRPGILKRSRGVAGYTENMKEVFPKMVSQYVKLKNTEAFINDFTGKFGIPVNIKDVETIAGGLKVGDKTYKGYKIVAPDNFLSFYKGQVDFYKEVSKRLDGMEFDDAIVDALMGSLEGAKTQFVGVSKNKQVFLVPEKITKNLESYATPIFSQKVHNAIKIVYDKPQGVWKDSVLAASPRWIKNNVIGDVIFNTMEGVGPLSYARGIMSKYYGIIPDDILKASFANVMKYNPKLGLAAKSTIGGMAEKLGQTGLVRGVSKAKDIGYGINTMFEQPFVRALYIKLARKEAKRLLKEAKLPLTEENIFKKLAEIKNSQTLREPLVAKVKETLPVFDLTGNLERKYLRRAMPFYNWYKFMTQYAAKLPVNHPFKTVGARGLGALSEVQREQAFAQMFPYMQQEIDENGIPERFDNLWPVKAPDQKGEAMFFNARGFNVFTTIEDITEGNFLNFMSPLIKLPIERGTGKESFTGRDFKTSDAGITFSPEGKPIYNENKKQLPPIGEHILTQFPHYKLLKESLVPARQWDDGTILNPKPILDKITGEYTYPIESVEKWLNLLGIDKKTLDVRETFDAYQKRKATAIGKVFTNQQSRADNAITLDEMKELFNNIKKDPVKWKIIKDTMKDNALREALKQRERVSKIKE